MVARSQYLFACCALLLATNVHATEWKTHTYVADGFQVEFSGQIEAVETKLPDVKKQVIRSTTYRQDGGDYGYQVFATLYSVKPNLDSAIKGALAICKTTISITPITIPNGIGREVFAENCPSSRSNKFEGRYFVRGSWLYQAITLVKTNGGDDQSAHHFVRSFKLIGK